MTSNTGSPTHVVRRALARHLIGTGLELGALHAPFPTPSSAINTRYVDRWTVEEAKDLFPELGEVDFTEADHIADLNTERLSMFGDQSQDFVIASHVLEHVANPLALLVDMHRVLRPGGTAIVLLPDMRRTSDCRREPTTVEHLLTEYERDVRDVDEAHLAEYALKVLQYEGEGQERKEYLAHLAERSVHAHAWTEEHFFPALHHAVGHLGCRFELVELLQTVEFEKNIEFGYVLRRTTAELSAEALAERLLEQRNHMIEYRTVRGLSIPETTRRLDQLAAAVRARDGRIARLERKVAAYELWIGPLRRSPLWPALRLANRLRRRSAQDGASTGQA